MPSSANNSNRSSKPAPQSGAANSDVALSRATKSLAIVIPRVLSSPSSVWRVERHSKRIISVAELLEFLDQLVKRVDIMTFECSVQMRVPTHIKVNVVLLFNSIDSCVAALLSKRAMLCA